MKRFAALLVAFCIAAVLAMPAAAVGYDPSAVYTVQAESAYVVNTDTNIIIYEKNSEQQVQAHSLTQLDKIAVAGLGRGLIHIYFSVTSLRGGGT